MISKPIKFLVMGTAVVDNVRIHDLDELGDFKDVAKHSYNAVGGSAPNTALALKALGEILGVKTDIRVYTKLGQAGPHNPEFETVQAALSGMHLLNLDPRKDYIIPSNFVVPFLGGRFLSKRFNEAHLPLDPHMIHHIETGAIDSDIAILHSRYPTVGNLTAKAAKHANALVIYDYSTEAPEGKKTPKTIAHSDIVLCPREARLPSMDKPNSDELLEKLYTNYNVPHSFVSGNSDPVKTILNGTVTEIPLTKVDNIVDTLGVGDLRDAAVGIFVAKGNKPALAVQKATAIASFSIQFPGREWIPHIEAHLRSHPLFINDFPSAPQTTLDLQ